MVYRVFQELLSKVMDTQIQVNFHDDKSLFLMFFYY
jgi:hypothetical protein